MSVLPEKEGRWSGGGAAVLRNLRFAERESFLRQLEARGLRLVPRNVVRRASGHGPYVLMPQNAWPWTGPASLPSTVRRRLPLLVASELAMRGARAVVRIGSAIPRRGNASAGTVANVLDEDFERALAERRLPPGPPAGGAIVCVGSFGEYRNLPRLIAGHLAYRRDGGRLGLIIGGPQGGLAGAVQRQAAADAATTILNVGVSREEALGLMSEAHGVLFPSLVEASPVTLLEAAVVARSVAASDIAGHREILPDGVRDVHHFDPTSTAAMTQACWQLESRHDDRTAHALQTADGREAARWRWASDLAAEFDRLL